MSSRLVLAILFALSAASGNRLRAIDAASLSGEWTLAVSFEGGPKLGTLVVKQDASDLQASIRGDGVSARPVSVQLIGDTVQLTYRPGDDDSGDLVTIELRVPEFQASEQPAPEIQALNHSLVGAVSAGRGVLQRTWGCRAARSESAQAKSLQDEAAAAVAARSDQTPSATTPQIADLLGSWQLSMRSALQEGSPTFAMSMTLMEVEGRTVVGIAHDRGPQRPVYRIDSLSDGIAFDYPTSFLGMLQGRMEVRRSGDQVSVQVNYIHDGTPLLTGTATRAQASSEISVDDELLAQDPQTVLVGWIRNAQVYAVLGSDVFVRQNDTLARISLKDPLLTPISFCRLPAMTRMISAVGSVVYCVSNDVSGIQAFDTTTPLAKEVRFCPIPGIPMEHSVTSGSLLIGENWNGKVDCQQIHVIDLSQPSDPKLITSYNTTKGVSIYEIEMVEHRIHLASGSGLVLIDASDPYSLRELSRFSARGTWVRGIASSESLVYLVTSIHDESSWMQIVDVSDPKEPREMATWALESAAKDVVASGSVAYVADAQCIHIMDAVDPANPRQRGYFRPRQKISKLSLVDDLVLCETQVDTIDDQGYVRPLTEVLLVRYIANEREQPSRNAR